MELYFQAWGKFLTFDGRAKRSEYWTFVLINIGVSFLLNFISPEIGSIFGLLTIIPHISVSVRRLHDINLSGWWAILFIPTVIPMLIAAFIDTKEKHSSSKEVTNNSNVLSTEDEIYEDIMNEIEENNKVKSTWAKALAQSDGDKDKAESLYINMRFDTLIQKERDNYKTINVELNQTFIDKTYKENNNSLKFDKAKEEYLKDLEKRKEDSKSATKRTEKEIFTQVDKVKEEQLKDSKQKESNFIYPEIASYHRNLALIILAIFLIPALYSLIFE